MMTFLGLLYTIPNCSAQSSFTADTLGLTRHFQKLDSLWDEGAYKLGLSLNNKEIINNANGRHRTDEERATLYYWQSRLFKNLGTYDSVIPYAKRGLKFLDNSNDLSLKVKCLNMIGIGHFRKSALDSTAYYYLKAYELKKEYRDTKEQLAISAYNLGSLFEYKGEYGTSIKYLNQALDFLQSLKGQEDFEADFFSALASNFGGFLNFKKAEDYIELAALQWRKLLSEKLQLYLEDTEGKRPFMVYRFVEAYRNQKLVALGYNPY
ncbi:MAG: hypothetical protein AAF149_22785, partial [Bacteroidota bacterium]